MKTNTTIPVLARCGKHCVTIEDGRKISDEATECLRNGGQVVLDFTGVMTVTSSFLNPAVGALFGRFNEEDLESHLSWTGLDRADTALLELVIENAKDYLRQPELVRRMRDRIVSQVIEDL